MKGFDSLSKYTKAFGLWFVLALAVGAVTGVVGAYFHKTIDFVTDFREENDIIIWFLPIVGIIITALYSLSKDKLTTNAAVDRFFTSAGI